ncbi:MAG: hypothetical protein IKG08_00125 [Eubacterium sp.]|nr:hypothetical protein [Eubacterium sp.]
MKRSRKIVNLLLALVLMAGLFSTAAPDMAFAAVDICPSGGEHDWIVYEIPATCTETGSREFQCTKCYATRDFEVIPALGHTWYVTGRSEPTCTQEGVINYTCRGCGVTTAESIPRTGHTPETIPGKAATCEESGLTEGQKCAVCGQILVPQETTEPTGHRWDTGKMVKEPESLSEDGEMLYICLNDPSHTKTETVSAASAILSTLRFLPKNPPKPKGEGTLEITVQPEGGSIVRFGPGKMGHTFTVEVKGGTEPYTYEWHAVDEEKAAAASSIAEGTAPAGNASIAEIVSGIISGNTEGKVASHTGFINGWINTFPAAEDVILPSLPVDGKLEIDLFSPYDKIVSNDPTLTTTGGRKTYYCIIRDDTGDWVETDHVALTYGLCLSEQPVNCNIQEKDEAPHVRAVDGRRPYSYEWFLLEDGQSVPAEDHDDTLNAKKSGDYYCIVTDDLGSKVQSNTISMYSAPALQIIGTSTSAESILDLQETVELDVYISGGVPPYSAHYTSFADGWVDVEAQTYTGTEYEADYHFPVTVDEADEYEFTVVDSKGKEAVATITLPYNQLKIKQQPLVSRITGKFTRMLEMEMAEGEFPLTYDLYRIDPSWEYDGLTDGFLVDSYTDESFRRELEIEDSGLYYFIITDSSGRWARTETVRVNVEYLWIYANTDYVQVEDDSKAVTLQVKVCGTGVTGVDSVTFDWFRINEQTREWIPIDENDPYVAVVHNVNYFTEGEYTGLENRIDVTMPGFYVCLATDAGGHEAVSESLWVNYVRPEPYFTVQPESVSIPGSSTAHPVATLTCEAVSADDYVRAANESRMTYSWERYENGTWKPVPVSSASTNTLVLVQEDEGAIDNTDTIPVISGRYRCKATEVSTQKYSYSNTAVVRHTLEFEFYSARINRDGSADITWKFMGGFRPHNIRVFTSKWRCVNKKKDIWERSPEDYPLREGWYDLKEEEGAVWLTLYNVPTLTWYGGSDNPHYDPMHYTIRVDSASETKFHKVEFTMVGTYSGETW